MLTTIYYVSVHKPCAVGAGHIHLGLIPGSRNAGEQGLNLYKTTLSILGHPNVLPQVRAPSTAFCTCPGVPPAAFQPKHRDIPSNPSAPHGQPKHENHRRILPKPAFPTQMRIFIIHARPRGCGGGSGCSLLTQDLSFLPCTSPNPNTACAQLGFPCATPPSIRGVLGKGR